MPYIGQEPRQGTIQKKLFVAVGGETSVSTSYSLVHVDVYLNGVLLVGNQDYTATDGSLITFLGDPLVANDVIEIHSVDTFEVANALIKTGDTITGDIDNNASGYFQVPQGTIAQRPGTPDSGYIRYNAELGQFEGYYASNWSQLGGGATGGGSDQAFVETDQVITTDYTLTAGKNAFTTGPIEINPGVTITIPSGATWAIV